MARQPRGRLCGPIEAALPYPLFVKPANLGSSVGISKVHDRHALGPAIDHAAEFDRKVVVEVAVHDAREIEVAVLGNDDARASVPGEIVPSREFYDYEAKYVDGHSRTEIPAPLDDAVRDRNRAPGTSRRSARSTDRVSRASISC